jgi:polyhydroxyalkanoate synthesis regulator phasin
VREGETIQVVDRTSGEDLTAVTLSQVVLDNERKRHGAVPEALLQQLVRSPGEVFKEAVRQSITAGQNLIQQAEERVVQQPEAAIEEARRTLQRIRIPGQGDVERLELRVAELTERVEALAGALERLQPGVTATGAKPRAAARAKPRARSATRRKPARRRDGGTATRGAA